MGAHRVTIDLPEHSYHLLRSVIESGEYASESDVVSETLETLRSDPMKDEEALRSWMLEEVLPAIHEYNADPSSGFTPEQLRHHLAQASNSWPDGS